MLGHGGSSAGSYLADPTSPMPSHCAVIILFSKCRSASILLTSTLRVKKYLMRVPAHSGTYECSYASCQILNIRLTLTVLVATIDALGHFETG